jgi:probable RNA-binding protein EIF1AD
MSQATKKKHVAREVLEDYPEPSESQSIVRISGPRGNNLHEAENASGELFLCSMPTKFRKNVWIKRGDFVIVESIEEGEKVKAEIIHILFPEQIRHLQKSGKWPTEFLEVQEKALAAKDEEQEEEADASSEEEEIFDEYGNSTRKGDDEDDDDDEEDGEAEGAAGEE